MVVRVAVVGLLLWATILLHVSSHIKSQTTQQGLAFKPGRCAARRCERQGDLDRSGHPPSGDQIKGCFCQKAAAGSPVLITSWQQDVNTAKERLTCSLAWFLRCSLPTPTSEIAAKSVARASSDTLSSQGPVVSAVGFPDEDWSQGFGPEPAPE